MQLAIAEMGLARKWGQGRGSDRSETHTALIGSHKSSHRIQLSQTCTFQTLTNFKSLDQGVYMRLQG